MSSKMKSSVAGGTREKKRSGAWTLAERLYAEKVVEGFHEGWLDIDDGTTLRYYLALLLNCDPKRVSKRMEKSDYKGRKGFQRNPSLSQEEVNSKRQDLEEWKVKFEESLEELRRARMGIFLPGEAPPSSGEEDNGDHGGGKEKISLSKKRAAATPPTAAAAPPLKMAKQTQQQPPPVAPVAVNNNPPVAAAAAAPPLGPSVASAFTSVADLANLKLPPSQQPQQLQQQAHQAQQQQQISWSNQGIDQNCLNLLSSALSTKPAPAPKPADGGNEGNRLNLILSQLAQSNTTMAPAPPPPPAPVAPPATPTNAVAVSSLLDQVMSQLGQQSSSIPRPPITVPSSMAPSTTQAPPVGQHGNLGLPMNGSNVGAPSQLSAVPFSTCTTAMTPQQHFMPSQAPAPTPPPTTTTAAPATTSIQDLLNLLNQHQQMTTAPQSASVVSSVRPPAPSVPCVPQQQPQQQGNLPLQFNSFSTQAPSSTATAAPASAPVGSCSSININDILSGLTGNNSSLTAAATLPTPPPPPQQPHSTGTVMGILELLQGQFPQPAQPQLQQVALQQIVRTGSPLTSILANRMRSTNNNINCKEY